MFRCNWRQTNGRKSNRILCTGFSVIGFISWPFTASAIGIWSWRILSWLFVTTSGWPMCWCVFLSYLLVVSCNVFIPSRINWVPNLPEMTQLCYLGTWPSIFVFPCWHLLMFFQFLQLLFCHPTVIITHSNLLIQSGQWLLDDSRSRACKFTWVLSVLLGAGNTSMIGTSWSLNRWYTGISLHATVIGCW